MRTLMILMLAAVVPALAGCKRPELPSLTGVNKFHDITQVRKGMSHNEVMRVMGTRYKTIYEEGIQGIDGGNYIWEYAEGRVYFNTEGVVRVLPYQAK